MIIDTNVDLSRWPFRRLAGDEPAELVARLRKQGVGQAWAGSFDGLLHRDIAGVNNRLAHDCRTYGQGFLVPFGSVNPKLPDWQEDLRRCQEEHKMPGIRLHPNYHGYTLDDPAFAELLKLATARHLIVQLVLSMEDTRTQHPLMQVPPVDATPLADQVKSEPGLRLVLLNWGPGMRGRQSSSALISSGNVYFDISTVEGIEGVGRLVKRIPLERILFGSHYPFFTIESVLLKMQESGLTPAEKNRIFAENARRLLA
jgi:predicted TIM-barrel fold metal-dependent hydrolase